MKTRLIIFISGLWIFTSCGKMKQDEIPVGIIPPKEMISLLADVQIAEALIQLHNTGQPDSVTELALSEYQYVFKLHHTNDSVFIKSFRYYSDHPELFAEMYKDVITTISKRQAEHNNK